MRAAPSDIPTKPVVRHRRIWWWIAAAALLLAAGGTVVYNRTRAVDVQSVAVLPPTASEDALARGITEEIADDLARVRGLKVEPQGTAQSTLETTVERADGRIRLLLRLTRNDGRQWQRIVERPLSELSSLPLDAAAFVSSQARKHAPKHKPPQAAYEPYLEGRGWFPKEDAASVNKAIDGFQRAVNVDPDFALAWAWLSIAHEYPADAGAARPNDMLPPARDAAERAVTIGPEIAEAHAALGIVRLQYDWEWKDAKRELDRALELNPGSRVAQYWRGRWQEATGRAAPRALTFANLPPHNDDAAGRKLLEDADDIRVETYISPVALALVANSLHDTEAVFHWLDVAYDERSPQLPYAIWDPALPRSDPRIADLMQRLNLPLTQ